MGCDVGYYTASPYAACTQYADDAFKLRNSERFYNVDSTRTNACKAGWFLSGIVGTTGGTTCTSCGYGAKECTSASVIKSCSGTNNLVNGICYPCTLMSATNAC